MVREAAQRWLEACGWRPGEPLREGGELLGGERAPKANDPQNVGLGYGMTSSSSPPSPDMPDLPDDDEGFRRIANFRPSAKAAGTATPRATVRRAALRPASPLNAARSGYYRTVEWVRPATSPSSAPSPRSPLAAPLRALAPAVVRPPPPPPRAAARPLVLRPARPAVATLPMRPPPSVARPPLRPPPPHGPPAGGARSFQRVPTTARSYADPQQQQLANLGSQQQRSLTLLAQEEAWVARPGLGRIRIPSPPPTRMGTSSGHQAIVDRVTRRIALLEARLQLLRPLP
ncbi:hypothetical protein BDZ88DRAFT_476810 [Geranomyces variabilis]|nr:hypothetical protein BDZ88DRAFT_476810 [Geranomyces variabilis]KAJ3135537.1 hypothetical protein HDU90_003940 [Geranomyces variabilis]